MAILQHFFICKEMLLKMDDVHLMLVAMFVFIASMSVQVLRRCQYMYIFLSCLKGSVSV